jgi:hypothetical protein
MASAESISFFSLKESSIHPISAYEGPIHDKSPSFS